MADPLSFRVDLHFLGQICSFLLWDYFWPINYAFFCCWTTFTLEMMVWCTMQSCLPLTEHVQPLYWAYRHKLTIFVTAFMDDYNSNKTQTETQTDRFYHLHPHYNFTCFLTISCVIHCTFECINPRDNRLDLTQLFTTSTVYPGKYVQAQLFCPDVKLWSDCIASCHKKSIPRFCRHSETRWYP